jgi:Xaa-Pro aminopeptidase
VAVDGQVLGLNLAADAAAALQDAGVRAAHRRRPAGAPSGPAAPACRRAVYEHRAPHAGAKPRRASWRRCAGHGTAGATHHFVSTVDDVAWITNLRGSDVSYNPVFLAHLLLDMTGGTLFVGAGKISETLAAALAADGIHARALRQAAAHCAGGPATGAAARPQARHARPAPEVALGCAVVEAINPSVLLKSRKQPQEAAFVREAMAEDGAAMCEFYAWFEAALARGERITELTVDEVLSAARARRPALWA